MIINSKDEQTKNKNGQKEREIFLNIEKRNRDAVELEIGYRDRAKQHAMCVVHKVSKEELPSGDLSIP